MTLNHSSLIRFARSALIALVLATPALARAQFDDPGLAPTPAPAPGSSATPSKSGFTNAASKSATGEPQGALVSTEVKEETKIEKATAADMTGEEWDLRLVAPSLTGQVGLFHMPTAEVGNPLNLRVASHLQFFQGSSFLIAGAGTAGQPGYVAGDQDSRFLGDFTISLTGPNVPFLRNLEAYLAIYNASNQNKRLDPGRTDPTVILSLADVGWGLKGAWLVGKGISLGGNVGVRFFNSVSDVAANFSATNVSIDALAMFDARKINSKAPVRIHLNAGYLVDNSLKLLPVDGAGNPQCYKSVGNDACIRSRVVQTFAYGLNSSRVRLALALDLPLRAKVKWGYFGIEPFVEYHLEVATTDGDPVVGGALRKQGMSDLSACGLDVACKGRVNDFYNGRVVNNLTQYLTLGLRFRPVARLVVDAGIDIALQSPGFQYGPPLATWNLIVGAAYTYGGENSQIKTVTKTVTKVYETNRRGAEGRIAGTVKDAKTGKAIAGAVIRYPIKGLTPQNTTDDGNFTSYYLPAGPIVLLVTHPDYEGANVSASVAPDDLGKLQVMLKPLPPKEGKVKVRVVDNKENPILNCAVKFIGPVTREAQLDGEVMLATIPAGDYAMSVDSPNYLAREKQVHVVANEDQTIDIELTKRPKTSHVELTQDQIIIKGTIHFATNEAKILPDGQQLLDEVADVLAKNPQLKKIGVEGHTDNSGIAEKNLKLSKDRAAAVVEYLVSKGIHKDRLTSEGFGSTKPLVPNISPANKAKNRRVEFHLLDQAKPAPAFPQ